MSDTAVLVTLVAGELQLYFASIIQQTNKEAKITLITGHDLSEKPEYVALRQNRLVYLVGNYEGVQQFNVEFILPLLNKYKYEEILEFLECVILNDIALENENAKDENAKNENAKDQNENAKNENAKNENAKNENENAKNENAKDQNAKDQNAKNENAKNAKNENEDENDLHIADLNLNTPDKITTGRTSFSSEERPPPPDIGPFHVFFPQDVINGWTTKKVKKTIAAIRKDKGYHALLDLVKQSKLSVSFLIHKVLGLSPNNNLIYLVTIGKCKITLRKINKSVSLERLNYLKLSDIIPVTAEKMYN